MLDARHFSETARRLTEYQSGRREALKLANDALAASKRAIFAMHRDDLDSAKRLLSEAEAGFAKVTAMAKERPGLDEEGACRAAREEYCEALLYLRWLESGDIGPVGGELVDDETYISGVSDLTGELQRRQVRQATEGKLEDVKKIKDDIEAVIAELLKMDLGGYLRNKFDQAKNNLRRAEDVLYDITLRRG
jgi:translin